MTNFIDKPIFNYLNTVFERLTRIQVSCFMCDNSCSVKHILCQQCCNDCYCWPCEDLLDFPDVTNHIEHGFIDELYCLHAYKEPISTWLKLIKYHQQTRLSKLLAQLIEPYLETINNQFEPIDFLQQKLILTIVPVNFNKWSNRGFNQCHEIIKRCSNLKQLNYWPDLLIQRSDEKHQVGLSGSSRRAKQISFSVNKNYNIAGFHVVIFDDVLTTGSTANALAKLLKQAGVTHVTVLTVALTKKNG